MNGEPAALRKRIRSAFPCRTSGFPMKRYIPATFLDKTASRSGRYVGFGNQTRTYVTAPHAYARLNGPNEI